MPQNRRASKNHTNKLQELALLLPVALRTSIKTKTTNSLRNLVEEMEVCVAGKESLLWGMNTQRKQGDAETKVTPDREEIRGWSR